MDALHRYQVMTVGLFLVALVHAFLTWSRRATIALFVGGFCIAFLLEAVAVAGGILHHNLHPQIAGVPVTIVLAWPSIIYFVYRVAVFIVPSGGTAAALTALLATGYDVLSDPRGVADGVWEYPESRISEPRYRGVPWWNFLAWFVIVYLTAMVPSVVSATS